MIKIEDYPLTRVPQDKRVSFLSVAIVHMGMLTALDQFMLGAVLGNSMTLIDAFTAIFVGSLIFGVVTYGLGMAGMREGISGSLLARWCGFGRLGSVLIGVVVAVSLLGWFGIQNAIFAKSLDFALGNKLGFGLAAGLSGTLLTILVAFGFKALRIAARIAVPMFIMLVAYISVTALSGHNLQEIIQLAPPGEPLTISAGITIVVGGAIVASLMTPDLTRYSKNGKHVLGVTIFTIVAGEFVVNGLAILIAKTLGTADVVTIMSQAAGGAGLLVVVFSTLRVNDLNLYSSSLGIVNAVEGITGKKLKYTYYHVGDRYSGHHAVGAGHSRPLRRLPDVAWRGLPAHYRHHAGGLLPAAQPPQNPGREPPYGPVAERNPNHRLGGDRRQHRRRRR